MRPRALLLPLLVTAAAVAACGDDAPEAATSGSASTNLPAAVVCSTQYRADADSLDGASEDTLRVDRVDDVETDDGQSLTFDTMTLTVAYVGDAPEGRNVRIVVTGSAAEPLYEVLYQLDGVDLAAVDFAGGHGFTGLQRVRDGSAELQLMCAAAD